MSRRDAAKVLELPRADVHALTSVTPTPEIAIATPTRASLLALCDDGSLLVQMPGVGPCSCDWLENGLALTPPLAVGDALLVLPASAGSRAVVLGRIGRYAGPAAGVNLSLESTGSLTLKCGEASIDLRADGKVMIRGDDVLVRAKGTQRIRAGSVSIN